MPRRGREPVGREARAAVRAWRAERPRELAGRVPVRGRERRPAARAGAVGEHQSAVRAADHRPAVRAAEVRVADHRPVVRVAGVRVWVADHRPVVRVAGVRVWVADHRPVVRVRRVAGHRVRVGPRALRSGPRVLGSRMSGLLRASLVADRPRELAPGERARAPRLPRVAGRRGQGPCFRTRRPPQAPRQRL
ncbi:hypothetical protein [Nocardia pseudobrasiliensis]|uniref:hypothetical protein n=1 Tax=Nocardia pseudobrasiliensis TaxID=45979 RepID=UPI0014775B7C|nr:hypothetical protein [Nocardia pseudobrasiliensis]